MPYSRTGAGLHRFTDTADGETYLALHSGLDNAQRVFAAFDQPDLKAAMTATVVAPDSWTVLGNGVARPAGPAGPLGPGLPTGALDFFLASDAVSLPYEEPEPPPVAAKAPPVTAKTNARTAITPLGVTPIRLLIDRNMAYLSSWRTEGTHAPRVLC